MNYRQQYFIDYIRKFAQENNIHIWLSGSFSSKTATLFSDVDISVFCDAENLKNLIYGYGKPVYLSFTHNPLGILIIIYEDGVAVDLEIIERIDIEGTEFFHIDNIKSYDYIRNEKLCVEFSDKSDIHYQISRLFHRSLIKFLSGKHDSGVSIANEISLFLDSKIIIDKSNYRNTFIDLLDNFNEQYPLPSEYLTILWELIKQLNN